MVDQTAADRIDYAVAVHRRHRKRHGMCLRCLRRYPCGVIRAFERGYVAGWDANPCNHPIELLETAWGIIANAGEGDWTRESKDWQGASKRFRESYFALLDAIKEEKK